MTENKKVWLNGRFIAWEKATVHLLSHGFSRGAAVFEVISAYKTPKGVAVFRLDEHLRRLKKSADILDMPLKYSTDQLEKAVFETVNANHMEDGFIKIMGYYSEESLGELVPSGAIDISILAVSNDAGLGLKDSKPIKTCLCQWRKLNNKTVPVEAKVSAHYLNGILARKEAKKRGFDYGLLLDTEGYVAEGATESVFMVKDSVLKTPSLGAILPGITRQSVITAARIADIKVEEIQASPIDLITADEIFTSSTPFKVLPVCQMEEKTLENAPGKITRQLSALINGICTGQDDRFQDWLFHTV